ncbi:MAG: ABC transporter permease [Trueperaceae bacterium]|nr:MAG: ABC transporter permease [Trueperaceae bacterium]
MIDTSPATAAGRDQSGFRLFLGRLLATPAGWIGTVITALVILLAISAPFVAPSEPLKIVPTDLLKPPGSPGHLFGADELGRDVLSRVIYGSRISLVVAGLSIGLAILTGVALGTSAGVAGGWWDYLVMRLMDALLAFPLLVLAIAISVALGRGVFGLVLAIAAVNMPVFTRLTRAQTLQLKERPFITATTAMGASALYKVWRHVIPNLLNALIVQATTATSFAIIIEAGLSFLGLGIQAPAPSWGVMIADAKTYMLVAPHLLFVPSSALFITVLGLNLLGDALSDALDPRMLEK